MGITRRPFAKALRGCSTQMLDVSLVTLAPLGPIAYLRPPTPSYLSSAGSQVNPGATSAAEPSSRFEHETDTIDHPGFTIFHTTVLATVTMNSTYEDVFIPANLLRLAASKTRIKCQNNFNCHLTSSIFCQHKGLYVPTLSTNHFNPFHELLQPLPRITSALSTHHFNPFHESLQPFPRITSSTVRMAT